MFDNLFTLKKTNPKIKQVETSTHIYFFSGPFGQWYSNPFEAPLTSTGKRLQFMSAEHYMMASKASLFKDYDILKK